MPRLRPTTTTAAHDRFGAATRAWTPEHGDSSLDRYLVKHGVAHLLWTGRTDEAEERMLDLHFMAAFVDAWETVVEPLACLRAIGLEAVLPPLMRRASEITAPTSTDDSAQIDTALTLAQFARDAGLLSFARALLSWADAVDPEAGDDRVLRAWVHLGSLEAQEGDLQAATTRIRRCLKVRERLHGPDSPPTQAVLNNLGELLRRQGQLEESTQVHAKLRRQRLDTLGSNHPDTAASELNLGLSLANAGQLDEAIVHVRRAVAAWKVTLGPGAPDTLLAESNLAVLYFNSGALEDAGELLGRSHQERSRLLGTHHPATAESANNLGYFYAARGGFELAEAAYREATEGFDHSFGPNHPRCRTVRSNLGDLFRTMERFEEALAEYAACLGTNGGPDSEGWSWHSATCLRKLDRPAEAAHYRRRCWQLESERDGEAAAGTLQTAHALAMDLLAAEEGAEAATVVQRALAAATHTTDEDDDRAKWVAKLRSLAT